MYNEPRGLTDEELREVAVQHLLRDTEHWEPIVTEADARAAIDRMRADYDRFGPEMAAERAHALWLADAPSRIIDLTDPAHVA